MVALAAAAASLCGSVKFWSNGRQKRRRKELELNELQERKQAEVARLQQSLDDTRAQLQTRDDAIAVLKTQTDRLKQESFETKQQLQTTLTQLHEREDAVGALKTQIDRLTADVAVVQKQLQDARHEGGVTKRDLVAVEDRARQTRRELDVVREKYEQTQELLQTRTAELKAAQTFLTTADKLSNVDVVNMIDKLNADMLQVSALVADAFTFEPKNESDLETIESAQVEEAIDRATETVGPRMVQLLMSSEHNEDPILVQIAFQGGMCAYVHWIISSWYFADPETDNDNERVLWDVYHHMRISDDQAIYGRWRAMTRKHARQMTSDNANLTMFFLDAFVMILITAGLKQEPSYIADMIQTRFADDIDRIIKKSQELKKVLGEDVTSCELEMLYFEPDYEFSEATMEDTFQDQSVKENGQTSEGVLCTTDLGLIRQEKIKDTGDWKETVLLKPKIVLQSKLNAIVASEEDG
ncbi:hypothetical protein APHAL10511_003522 [Amanita phalloides]|nr:hypothetical protein APHAL10511_003522 [Amanita phalloides]